MAPGRPIFQFYNGRGIAVQWIKEGKYALSWIRLSCHRFMANQVRLWLFMLALRPHLRRLSATGYFHAVSAMAHTQYPEVCMTIFLMEKGDAATRKTEVALSDLPIKVLLPTTGTNVRAIQTYP